MLSVPSKRVESLQHYNTMPNGNQKPVLSVPSKRVESLQQDISWLWHPYIPIFQYPPSGSSRCNKPTPCGFPHGFRSFQYPPSGSSRCNTSANGRRFTRCRTFSTLQAGRVAATFPHGLLFLFQKFTFSTLQAGRVAATCPAQYQGMTIPLLSVPSKRVESLQLTGVGRPVYDDLTFSTLQAGRVAATAGVIP